jgi:hypothetical protein
MATGKTSIPIQHDESQMLAHTYQQAMQNLTAVVEANPLDGGVVTLQPKTLTKVNVQAGQHYKVRKLGNDGQTLETPDNVVAVRHGDALHLRYADGSTASFENFYSVCTGSSVCSVNLADDSAGGITLSGADASDGVVADDGLMVYAHGDHDTLMTMAEDQAGMSSAILALGDAQVLTYLPPDSHPAALALLALGMVGAASAGIGSGASGVSAAIAGASSVAVADVAIEQIRDAAQNNTAISSSLAASVYSAAGVTGVTTANLAAINSALDSTAVTGVQADTRQEVQAIVDAYNTILASADGVGGNTTRAPTAAQYAAIGVTGVSGTPAADIPIFLLNNAVDAMSTAGVDTVDEVQAMADAAYRVIAAAGGNSAQIAALTQADLSALGITGVTASLLPAVQMAIGATTPDTAIDTVVEIQALVNTVAGNVANALNIIRDAAQNNTATNTAPGLSIYAAAGVTGVVTGNLAAINSALDSFSVTGAQADTAQKVQVIVDSYNTILNSADGISGNTLVAPTGMQYAAIGVTGVSGTATPGTALYLLDDVVDASLRASVDTEPEVQAIADAAAHVMAAAGGSASQAAALTVADFVALGIAGVTAANLAAVQASIQATVPDSAVDTKSELQTIVNTAAGSIGTALNIIRDAAQNNTANATTPGLSIYAAAGVTGVTAADLASINSALDSAAVTGAQADTTAEVQDIVNAYNAILSSADGVADNTATALTGPQYTLVGVTGVSGTSAPGNALHLLDSVVDASPMLAVDTVPELQAMADAAAHVITGAAAGTGPTLSDLGALGITGVTGANLASVQAGIAATPDNGTGVDTQAELQAIVTATINSHPNISTALSGVTNLDVTSNLVLNVDQSLTVGTGFIRITDMGGTGYQGDTSNNTQTIDVATAVANHLLTISGTGANTHIIINPLWDLDLASNYQITIDDGAFMNATGTQAASHIAPISFSTVAPGIHIAGTAATEAHASQAMVDATGALVAGKSWLDIQGIGNNTGAVTQLGDLSTGAYALVMKNYATQRGGDPLLGGNASDGIATYDTNIGVQNFGNNDIVYFDGQVNNSATQFFDARYTGMTDGANVGGLVGQNALVMGLVSSPLQQGSTAMILLGLEGNSANTVYPSIVSLPDGTVGWANVWHNTSPAVLMG